MNSTRRTWCRGSIAAAMALFVLLAPAAPAAALTADLSVTVTASNVSATDYAVAMPTVGPIRHRVSLLVTLPEA